MAEASGVNSPPLDIDGIVVDLHTNRATAATAAQALLNENSNASSEAGLNLKFPVLFTSSSESESEQQFTEQHQQNPLHSRLGGNGDENAATTTTTTTSGTLTRPSSPPPNCAICLGRCKNKCFTNSCVHQFCFKCLAEWSKVKAECPLCKQPFRSIIHNVKSNNQFEEYHVQTPTVQLPHSPLEVTYQGPLRGFSVNGSRFYNFSMRSYPRSHAIPTRGPITYHEFGAGGSIPASASMAVETMPVRHADFFRRQMSDEYGNDLPVGQLWRRYIYDRKLYALPVSDITGRFRECSARFYRDNPGQIVRLIPFANRDLVCLLRNTNHSVTRVLETLNRGLEVSNILSRSFRRRLQPFLGERTAHFIHELSNFARSPYDMIGYDDYVQYAPQYVGEDQIIEFSSSGGEGGETNNNTNANNNNNNANNIDENPTSTSTDSRSSSRRRRAAQAATNSANTSSPSSFAPMSLLSFTITTTTEGSEAPGVSVAVSAGSRGGHAQVAAINLSTHNRAHNEVVIDLDETIEMNGSVNNGGILNAAAGGGVTEIANGGTVVVSANATTTSINGGGLAEATSSNAATHQGSPHVVASIALSTSSSDECEFVLERKPPHLRTPEMVSLNSESDSDVVFVEETKPILAEATYSTSDEGGNKNTPTLATLMKEQEQLRERERQCNESTAASTSAGLRSRTLRQIVAAKRSNSSHTATEAASDVPVKRRRTRCQRGTGLNKTLKSYNSDDSSTTTTEDDSDDDSDFASSSLRSKRGRGRGRRNASSSSAAAKRRGSSNARKRGSLSGRKSRKRARANSSIKIELAKQTTSDHYSQQENSNETTSQTTRQRRRRSSRSSPTKDNAHYSTENDESSTEEDEKVNLRALQLRLKTSLSDVEANMAEEEQEQQQQQQATMQDDNFNYSISYSPKMPTDFSRSRAQNEHENENFAAANSNSNDTDSLIKSQRNINTNISPIDNLDERPSTSAAAAAAAAALKSSTQTFNIHHDDDSVTNSDDDNNDEVANNATSLRTSPDSETNLRLQCSSPLSTSSHSTMNSFQMPSTSQQNQQQQHHNSNKEKHNISVKFSSRFKYSSSSDSTTNSSSASSSGTQSSASATSASEDELN